jgi:hypothetical protein
VRDEKKKDCIHRFAVLLGLVSPGWIAGGAIRDHFASQQIESDIDIFFKSQQDYQATIDKLADSRLVERKYIHKELACFAWREVKVRIP